jgi:hypothetical protein
MRRLKLIISSILLLGLLVVACAPSPTPVPAATRVPATVAVTAPTTAPTPVPTTDTPPTAAPATRAPTAAPPTSAPPTLPPTEPPAPTLAAEPTAATVSGTAWNADGQISAGEYARMQQIGEVTLHWSNDAESLTMALQGRTTGWVAVGLAPVKRMQGANFIFGYVKDGTTSIWDAFGQAETGATHPPDDQIGGKNDIRAFAGAEMDGVTVIEFQIPLDSGDAYDQPLKAGSDVPLIVAIGRADDFKAVHSFRGGATITLD